MMNESSLLQVSKNKKDTLAVQISNTLSEHIRRGYFSPGAALPSERRLAEMFQVCRTTIMESLNILVNDGIIEKVPQKGNFVRRTDIPLKIVLLYPGEHIVPESTNTETGLIFSEFYRGVLAGASELNAELVFKFLPESTDPQVIVRQAEQLQEYDAVIFPSWQLQGLQAKLFGSKPLIRIGNDIVSSDHTEYCSQVRFDLSEALENICRAGLEKGYREASVLSMDLLADCATPEDCEAARHGENWFDHRLAMFKEAAARTGLNLNPENILKCRRVEIAKVLKKLCGTFIFLNHTEVVPDIYNAARATGLKIGQDFAVTTLCSGLTLKNLSPAFSYLRIKFFQEGVECMSLAVRQARSKNIKVENIIVPTEFISAESI